MCVTVELNAHACISCYAHYQSPSLPIQHRPSNAELVKYKVLQAYTLPGSGKLLALLTITLPITIVGAWFYRNASGEDWCVSDLACLFCLHQTSRGTKRSVAGSALDVITQSPLPPAGPPPSCARTTSSTRCPRRSQGKTGVCLWCQPTECISRVHPPQRLIRLSLSFPFEPGPGPASS